jgi:hypothetical protein
LQIGKVLLGPRKHFFPQRRIIKVRSWVPGDCLRQPRVADRRV